jgi:hypothetical protein
LAQSLLKFEWQLFKTTIQAGIYKRNFGDDL